MSPTFYFFLWGGTLKSIISPNHLQWPPHCVQTHTNNNWGKWSLFLLFKPTCFDFTRRLNVLPYKVFKNHHVPPILSQYKFLFSMTYSKLGLPVGQHCKLWFHANGHNIVQLHFSGHRKIEMLGFVVLKLWLVSNYQCNKCQICYGSMQTDAATYLAQQCCMLLASQQCCTCLHGPL